VSLGKAPKEARERRLKFLWYVAGFVNCVERKAGFVFETPKAREKDSASLKILSVRAFDHDPDIVLHQHRSNDYRIFSPEVVSHAHGSTSTATISPARRVARYTPARNEEFGKLVHEFAGRISAAMHKLRAIRESSEEF